MKYSIINANSTEDLASNVNEGIAKGWTPIGGIAIEFDTGLENAFYYQSMILYEDEDEDQV